MGVIRVLTDPNIGRHLLRDEGEVIVDEVRHHWIVFVLPTLGLLVALMLFATVLFAPTGIGWLPFAAGSLIGGYSGWKWLSAHMDRFVVTNMRVFRVKGVFAQQQATMPLVRILDITVKKPFHGRLLGFGHFIFESAAREQGLRDIRYVGRPDQRDLAIQRVLQRSGLRGPRTN